MFTFRWWAANVAVFAGGVSIMGLFLLPHNQVNVALMISIWILAGLLYMLVGEV